MSFCVLDFVECQKYRDYEEVNITYSKKSDFIPLIGHGDPVPHISRSMEFTKDLWTSQSKNQDTLGQNMYESKKSDEKRTILRSSAPKYMKIYEIHKFDL